LLGCAAAVREGLLARGIDVPVIDPIPNVIMLAAAMARQGLAQSALTYPHPPEKELIGYPHIKRPLATAA
jgi:allantoin racemase